MDQSPKRSSSVDDEYEEPAQHPNSEEESQNSDDSNSKKMPDFVWCRGPYFDESKYRVASEQFYDVEPYESTDDDSDAPANSVSSLASPSPANPGSTTSNNSEAALPDISAHSTTDHQLLQQPDPVDSLYVRHLFEKFDHFVHWKTSEEERSGVEYKPCYTNEYPHSIYFKCSAIRTTRITLADKSSTSCNEPPPVEPGSKGSPSGASSVSEAGGEKSSSNTNPNEVERKSSFDARMYPCPSSIRLETSEEGIVAIHHPYHDHGHELESQMRDRQTEGGQHHVTDQMLLLKEADDMSNASVGSSGGQI